VAADLLGNVTVLKLDRAVRRSERLQGVFLAIKQVKALPEYDRITAEQLEAEIVRRLTVYRADALDSLHELATMDHGENSAMAQVRLAAAARLTGPMGGTKDVGSDLEQTMRELNEAYHREAPKIKVTRQTTIEISRDERVVEGSAAHASD
jgi:hypothetical protein